MMGYDENYWRDQCVVDGEKPEVDSADELS